MTANCKEVLEAAERRLQLLWQEKRLETFKTWPFGDEAPCSAYKLAEAGFFFTGNSRDPDSVQCFLCEKALDGWDENDDPWAEHLSHSLNCTFAQLGQPEEALTFQQMINFHIELSEKEIEKAMELVQSSSNKLFNLRLAKLKRSLHNTRKH